MLSMLSRASWISVALRRDCMVGNLGLLRRISQQLDKVQHRPTKYCSWHLQSPARRPARENSAAQQRWFSRTCLRWATEDDGNDTTCSIERLAPGDIRSPGRDGAEQSERKPVIISPTTVQVFADATMVQTVREVAVDIQKIKGHLTFMRDDFSDTAFEVLKLSQGRSSIVAALKESRKRCRDNQSAITKLTADQNKIDQLIGLVSKMVAKHENQLNDLGHATPGENMESMSKRIKKVDNDVKRLAVSVCEQLQIDVRKARVEVTQFRNDINRLELEVKHVGREIEKLKGKASVRPSPIQDTKK